MQSRWRFAKNAVANLGRGSAAAVVAVLLPPVLVRHMTPAAYAVWVLVLQTAGYVSYLNFGLQTAIGRYVAYANEKKDVEQRDSVFSTAFAGLCCAALISLVCLAVAILAAPVVFPSVPSPLIAPMRLALLLVGFSLAVELPASACNGVFIGMQRYEIPALTTGGGRLIAARWRGCRRIGRTLAGGDGGHHRRRQFSLLWRAVHGAPPDCSRSPLPAGTGSAFGGPRVVWLLPGTDRDDVFDAAGHGSGSGAGCTL